MMSKDEEERATESNRPRGARHKAKTKPEGVPEVASRGRPLRVLHTGSYTQVAYLTGSMLSLQTLIRADTWMHCL